MKGLIYLNLHAEGYYSGAKYDETIFITPQDYLKYFSKNTGIETEQLEVDKTYADEFVEFTDEEVKKVYQLAKSAWHEKVICVGELDGKHSEVDGEVYVDFFDEESIKNHYNETSNDGNCLMQDLLYTNDISNYTEQRKIIKEIKDNVDKAVEEIGVYIEVKYRVPREKVEELNKIVEELKNGRR